MSTLGDKVEEAMSRAGIKARTFAALVGCHYTTIYDLLKDRDTVVPLRIVQDQIYDVLDFLSEAADSGRVPLVNTLTVSEKTQELETMYSSYKMRKANTA